MSGASNFLENAIFNHVLRNTAYTSPTTVYLALFTDDPTDADTGTEVSGGSYARQTIAFDSPTNGVGANTATVTFPTPTASWGTVTHVGIYDASTGGNLLVHAALAQEKVAGIGDTVRFNAGDLTVSVV